jgi:hypothetical protein
LQSASGGPASATYDRWCLIEVRGGYIVVHEWSHPRRIDGQPDKGRVAMAAQWLLEDRSPISAAARRKLKGLITAGALRKPG